MDHRLRQPHSLQHPFRVLPQPQIVRPLFQPHQVQQFRNPFVPRGRQHPRKRAVEIEHLPSGHIRRKPVVFRQIPDGPSRLRLPRIAPEYQRPPRRRMRAGKQHFYERGLARAIRPQQSVRGPPPYPQRHVVYRRQRPPRPPVLKNLRQAFRVDRVPGRKFTHALTITNREAGSFAILLFVMPAATRFAAVALLFGCSLGAAPVSDARYAHLARGVNLTRWFQYGSPQPIGESDRDLIKNAGFTAVRIPVAPQYLLPRWASPAEIAQTLDRLDRGIDLFLHAGLAVTLDFQADTEYLDHFLSTPGASRELVETWRMLAARYQNRNPELLFFEIMNEPDSRFTQAFWDRVQFEALRAIHQVAPAHTVLLAPAQWSGLEALLQMTPARDDQNVIYVLHYYSPTTFTHQGAAWVTDQPGIETLRDVPWPAFLRARDQSDPAAAERLARYQAEDWDRDHISWDMSLAARWARQWNVRVIVNEFGAYKPFAAPGSRARWLHDVRTAIEQNGLAWAVWDYAAGFDVVNVSNGVTAIDPLVSAALGLTPWTAPDPARTDHPPFTGPRVVQIGAQPENTAGPAFIAAVCDKVILTSTTENPVRLFVNRAGILQPLPFEGPPPVVTNTPIVPGPFGLFFPGQPSRLAVPSGNTFRDSGLELPAAVSATVIDRDIVLFGDQLAVFETGHLIPGAFPPKTPSFNCGVFAHNQLSAFGKGTGMTFRYKGHGKFKRGKPLTPNAGEGPCTAITGPKDQVIVAWSNGTIQIAGKSPIAAVPNIRNIALAGNTLVISAPPHPPCFTRGNPTAPGRPST